MPEQEPANSYRDLRYNIQNDLYNLLDLKVELQEPILDSSDNRLTLMHSNERNYTGFLLQKGITVFPEPELIDFNHTPDFFVWKPNTKIFETPYSGVFIELTLCTRRDLEGDSRSCSKKYARKRRQKKVFESLGWPVMYICREDQERIREYSFPRLF
jgi:hypothetical protein